MRLAFALAGLGGFNAHGAGFLAAAARWGLKPDLVTATSGQILVLADWLRGEKDLRASLVSERAGNPMAQLQTAMFGLPGVFRPAYHEAMARLAAFPDFRKGLLNIFADRVLPAQQYVPARSEASFQAAADTLNASSIGVVFNSYDPRSGTGFLYGNDAARAAHVSAERDIHPITADAVKSALWLSLYGFASIPGGQMDGAYHRSCIVSELHDFDRIFVARPLANGWYGKAPANWFEVQDWQCEMWFSVGYKAEVDALKRINDLIDVGVITSEKFRKVELVEIEPETPAGYFNYFVERPDVYDKALALSEKTFASLGLRKPG